MSYRNDKYDRQLRLWASNGQANIENCHICVIGLTTANTELLKNLILPGCGEFTIIDNDETRDFSHNFFWSEEDSILDNLKSLNPEVKGNLLKEPIGQLIDEKSASFWEQFSILIMDDSIPSTKQEDKLINTMWNLEIPIIKNVTYGFYGFTKVIIKEHSIIETHPESLVDLRIGDAWAELDSYVDSIQFEELSDVDHAHIPYVVVLIKLLKSWKRSHNDEPPTPRDRELFKNLVESMRRTPTEENYLEAVQFAHRATNPPVLKQSVADIINSSPEPNLSTSLFWVYTKALQKFMEKNNNQLPLSGVLPDMVSDTLNYVKLQQIYKRKFNRDRDAFLEEVRTIVTTVGRSTDEISEEMANIFCKNARFLTVQKGGKEPLSHSLLAELTNSHYQLNYLKIYLAFLCVDQLKKSGGKLELFSKEHNLQMLQQQLQSLFTKYKINIELYDEEFEKIIEEFTRSGGTELHNIASMMGGIGSQEALKFITGQYVPIDNLLVLDGIVSHTECIKI